MKEDVFEAEKQQLVVLDSHGFETKAKRREWTPSGAAPAPSTPLPSIPIPRRPVWTSSMTAEALQAAEHAAFLTWRRGLAELEEGGGGVDDPLREKRGGVEAAVASHRALCGSGHDSRREESSAVSKRRHGEIRRGGGAERRGKWGEVECAGHQQGGLPVGGAEEGCGCSTSIERE